MLLTLYLLLCLFLGASYRAEGFREKSGIWGRPTDVESLYRTTALFALGLTETAEGVGMIPPAPRGKNIWGSVVINDRGQIVIPKGARDKFGLTGGQRLLVGSDEEGIALFPAELFEEKLRQAMELINGQNIV